MEESIEFARRSPEPDPATAHLHVYADPMNPADAFAAAPRGHHLRRDRLARRRARRHRRGDAAQRRHHLFRRRHGRARRHLRAHQESLPGVRGRPHGRHADLRARLHRRVARRIGDRRALHRRPDVRRLPVRGRRPDRAAGGQAALHVQRPDDRADGDPRRRRRGALRRARTTPAPTIRSGRISPASSSACPRRRPTPRA